MAAGRLSIRNGTERRFFGRALVMALGALAAGLLAVPCFGAAEPVALFKCTNLVSGATWTIRIDFEKRTVDAYPAKISRTEISWRDGPDGGHYTLDRKSGALTVVYASSTGGYFIHDRCTHSVR
jgi:hypothetical protein